MNAPQQPPRTALEQLLADEIAHRADAQQHLADYARRVVGVTPALHHRYICDELERGILNDEWDDCVICIPPGGAKSTYASHCLPAWFLGHFPDNNVILASHTATLAEKWSRRVRDTVASPEHTRVFEHSTLSRDSTAVSKWSTSKNGEFLAAGVGMSILGFRADLCCVENTYLTSRTNKVSIADVDIGTEVLGYDEHSKTPAYGRVVAKRWRTTDITYRVHTTDGHMVEATGNHPFFVRGCWKEADTLVVGDALLSMLPSYDNDSRIATGEVVEADNLRRTVLFSELLKQAANTLHKVVCDLRDYLQTKIQIGASVFEKMRWKITQGLETHSLQPLWKRVSAEGNTFNLLFNGLQERGTFTENAGAGKSSVSWWDRKKQISKTRRSDDLLAASNGERTGQRRVRDLQIDGQSSNAPCGSRCDEQLAEKLGYSVQELSRNTSRCGKRIASETFISRIEVVRGEQRVWDIQVDELHNFAANSLILHNCVLDDPVAGWEQAQSATQLEKIHNWFKFDLKSRLKPSAKIITICQRTAAYDMAGYMMKEFAKNPTRRLRTIVLPMLAGENDPLGRAPGERLWPEWYTPEMVTDLSKDEFTWKTMYQQEPPSDTGSWITVDDIRHRPSPVISGETPIYGLTDLALSVNTGDYTVHFIVAIDPDGNWDILEADRKRVDPEQTATRIVSYCETYAPREWLIDDDNMAKVMIHLVSTKAQQLRVHVPWKMLPMRGQDKETRAAPLCGQFKRRKIYYPADAPFARWLTEELLMFPNGVGSGVDDGIDALGLLGRRMSAIAPARTTVAPPVKQGYSLNDLWDDMPQQSTRM